MQCREECTLSKPSRALAAWPLDVLGYGRLRRPQWAQTESDNPRWRLPTRCLRFLSCGMCNSLRGLDTTSTSAYGVGEVGTERNRQDQHLAQGCLGAPTSMRDLESETRCGRTSTWNARSLIDIPTTLSAPSRVSKCAIMIAQSFAVRTYSLRDTHILCANMLVQSTG